MHIPSGNQLMLRRLMCLNKGLSIYLSINILVDWLPTPIRARGLGRTGYLSLSRHDKMPSGSIHTETPPPPPNSTGPPSLSS